MHSPLDLSLRVAGIMRRKINPTEPDFEDSDPGGELVAVACYRCEGLGTIIHTLGRSTYFEPCPRCDGSGLLPVTDVNR